MATLISSATGNFSASGTWKTADTTSLLDSETANTALTSSAVASSAFTPGAITVDGILIHLASVAGATGTITVALETGGNAVAATSVTQNISTLPTCTTAANEGGWVLFQFAATTLLAATAYKVRASVSVGASTVNLYSLATTNWSRMLRRSTNVGAAAPTTGDVLYVMGELTGTAATTSWTVTMDATSTNQLGGVSICKYGTLSYGTTGGQSYYLKTIGNQASTPGVIVYSGGTLTMGTSGTAMNSTSTAVLEFNAASDGQYGLTVMNGGTLQTQGATVTTIATFLAADVAANAASFTTSVSTGWASGDVVAIASTTRTPGDTEQITLGTVTGTTCNVSVGGGTGGNTVRVAHSGTGSTKAEVVHLTRNVKIRNASSSFAAYVSCPSGSPTVSCAYTEFYNLGANVANQRGIDLGISGGSVTIDHCSLHDMRNFGFNNSSSSGTVTLSNCCCYNLNNLATAGSPVTGAAQNSASAPTISGNYILGCSSSGSGATQGNALYCGGGSSTVVSTNTIAGNTAPSGALGGLTSLQTVSWSGNVIHSNSSRGIRLSGDGITATLTSHTVWRNNGSGIDVANGPDRIVLLSCTFFGNTTNISPAGCNDLILASCNIQGDSSFSVPSGISVAARVISLFDCTLGTTTAHTSGDLVWGNFGNTLVQAWRTTFGSSTQASINSQNSGGAILRSHQDGNVATAYKCTYMRGTIQANQSTRHTASGYSWKLTPTSANGAGLVFPGPGVLDTIKIPVRANTAVTLSCWMQKDSSYNGSAPIMTIVGGVIGGVGSAGTDITTTATLTSSGTWYQVTSSAVTPTEDGAIEFYISCPGTAGNVYIDDIALA